ncbi:MAG: hypothetical protein M3P18_03050 [Actinomycetota bacterium]|nr:hypothetical protein [Actinomycetota bacterium]
MLGCGHLVATIEDALHAEEDRLGDERFEVAARGDPEITDVDLSDVGAVAQHAVERLGWNRLAASRREAEGVDVLADLVLREKPSGEVLEGSSHEGCPFRIGNQAPAGRPVRVQVTKRREKCPPPELQSRFHAAARSLRTHVVVKLGEGGEHTFHQLAGRRVVNRLGGRTERDPERLQVSSKGEMVVFLPSKSRQVEHYDELDPALVRSAEVQQLLKFGAIGGLRALAFLAKARDDLEALARAVFLARLELRRETQILGLLFRADADVDDSTDHRPQLRPVRELRQADHRPLLMHARSLFEKQLNQNARERLRVPADASNVLVGKAIGFVGQQLATPLDRDVLSDRCLDLVHPHAQSLSVDQRL